VVQAEPDRKALAENGLVENATECWAVDRDGLHPKANDPSSADIHDDQNPMTLKQNGFSPKQVDTPQTVLGLAQQGEPGEPLVRVFWSIMGRQNSPDDVLVHLDCEGSAICCAILEQPLSLITASATDNAVIAR